MSATNTSTLIGTTPTMLFATVPSGKKVILNTSVTNSNTSSSILVSLFAIPMGQSTSSPPLISLVGGMPLSIFGSLSATQQRTGDVLMSGYSLFATANATGTVAFISGEIVTDY